MNFSEFLSEEEELDLVSAALIEEGVVGSALRAAGGFGGNLIQQSARGAYNVASGAARTVRGVGKIGLGAVQGLTGAGKQGLSSVSSGIGDVASGIGSGVAGAAQAAGALSGVTPTLRAIQAANEKSFFTPTSKRRTGLQKAMGLNSRDPDGDAKKDSADRFEQLKKDYRVAEKAGNRDRMRQIRAEMSKIDPAAYRVLVAKGRALRDENQRKKWADIASRVKGQERPEDFFRRLGSEG